MITRDTTQLSIQVDDSNEQLMQRIETLNKRIDDFQQALSLEDQQPFVDLIHKDQVLGEMTDGSWRRVEDEYFHDSPIFEADVFEVGKQVDIPSSPMQLIQDVMKRLDIYTVQKIPDESPVQREERILRDSTRMLRKTLDLGYLDPDLVDKTIDSNGEERLLFKDGKLLANLAKKNTTAYLEDLHPIFHEGTVGEGIQQLMRIYIHTSMSGKKAFNYTVADSLDGFIGKYLLKNFTKADDAVLDELRVLMSTNDLTDEQKQRVYEIGDKNQNLFKFAMLTMTTSYVHSALTGSAKHDIHQDIANRMRGFVGKRVTDTLRAPQELVAYLEKVCEVIGIDSSVGEPDTALFVPETENRYNLHPMELDWEVLPPGESELEKGARQIVEDVSVRTGKRPEIDLNRLNILEGIREQWGKDRSYYSRGVRKKRSVVHDTGGHEQPDEYIILVLQEPDAKTGLVREHVVAESPIAGPNALYIYRPDTTDHRHDWRTVMSLPKDRSRQLGARDVKHTTSKGSRDLNDTMIEKAIHLLTVPPAEFETLKFNGVDKEGSVRVSRTLGRSADRLTR